jgi:hypothetical protein
MGRRSHRRDEYDHHRGAEPLLRRTAVWRAMVFVGLNALVFVGVSAFWQYLSTGQWIGVNAFVENLFLPLGAAFLNPMPVYVYRWMIPVYGLLLGVTIFIPIIVAILYRMRVVVVFVILLVVAAQQPLLALAVAVGCVLASHTPLRSNMSMVAALLGLLPVWVYLLGMGSLTLAGTTDWDYWETLMPMRRWVMYAPYAVALAVSVVGSSITLWLVRLMRFRPGAVWPVLLVLSAAPIGLFYLKVGPAELEYAQLMHHVEPNAMVLSARSQDEWLAEHPEASLLSTEDLRTEVQTSLLARRDRMIGGCEQFLERYAESERAPEVLWVLGQCKSLTLDDAAFDHGGIRGSSSYVLPASRDVWTQLAEDYPKSPQAGLGRWHLGMLLLREGKTRQGYGELLEARNRLMAALREMPDDRDRFEHTFIDSDMMPSASVYRAALQSVREWLWLIERKNLVNDVRGGEALAAYLNVDPRGPLATVYYSQLAEQYADTVMGKNLLLAAVLREPDPYERAARLLPLVDQDDATDVSMAAAWELGLIHTRTARTLEDYRSPETYLRSSLSVPNSPWRARAERQLDWLEFAREVQP